MKKLLLLLLASACTTLLYSQGPPKRELRGAWIATFSNIDWPNRTQTPTQQRAALISILDHHAATGINTIYLQVRSQCDAMYPSSIEPWSADLTNLQGRAPSPAWDPLQFAIDECRRRGMELHAWLNPYRVASLASNLSNFSTSHIGRQRPDLTLNVGPGIILNPGLPEVRNYITSVVVDILKRYDVDGIHFDDYFYPAGTIADDAAYNSDPRGFTSRNEWRRDNINLFIKRIYDSVRTLKPWVKFGVSPTGIYRNSTNPAIGTNTSGLEHYTTYFADTKRWIAEGWVDYIAPQVYWFIGQAGSNYSVVTPWWNNQSAGRHIYIGLAGYKVNDPAQGVNWANPSQIPNQVRLNRTLANVQGQIVYNTSSMRSTTRLGFRDSLRLFFYNKPALLPTMPWRDNTPPSAATALTAKRWSDDSVVLNWTKPAAATNEVDKVRRFVVYRSLTPDININDANNILAITVNDTTAFRDVKISPDTRYYYTVTALDRFHNESTVSNAVADLPPSVTCPSAQTLTLDAACTAVLPDFTGDAVLSHAVSISQLPAPGTTLEGSGTTTVTLTAINAVGQTAQCSFTVTREDKTPPSIQPLGSIINGLVNMSTEPGVCYKAAGTALDISANDNCSGPLTYSYTLTHNGITSAPVTASSLAGVNFAKGQTVVAWTVADPSGNSSQYSYTVMVNDTEAPVITAASVDPAVLFPANHKMRNVAVHYTATDNCGAVTTTLSVSSNEAVGRHPDWIVMNNHLVKLRAERNGTGNGRIYSITITATDGSGNTSNEVVTVLVPHDQSGLMVQSKLAPQKEAGEFLTVKATPNPSNNQFALNLQSAGEESITVRVTDQLGRNVFSRQGVPSSGVFYLGAEWRPGVYVVEIIQGAQRQQLKLIKIKQ